MELLQNILGFLLAILFCFSIAGIVIYIGIKQHRSELETLILREEIAQAKEIRNTLAQTYKQLQGENWQFCKHHIKPGTTPKNALKETLQHELRESYDLAKSLNHTLAQHHSKTPHRSTGL